MIRFLSIVMPWVMIAVAGGSGFYVIVTARNSPNFFHIVTAICVIALIAIMFFEFHKYGMD